MSNELQLHPWPGDAVMIVCATPEEAITEFMESVNPAECRDCGKALVVDGFTLRRANAPQLARGRPIKFFCIDCHRNYDVNSITHLEDHRGPK